MIYCPEKGNDLAKFWEKFIRKLFIGSQFQYRVKKLFPSNFEFTGLFGKNGRKKSILMHYGYHPGTTPTVHQSFTVQFGCFTLVPELYDNTGTSIDSKRGLQCLQEMITPSFEKCIICFLSRIFLIISIRTFISKIYNRK